MPLDCTFHPVDEALINKFYNNGLEFGPSSVEMDAISRQIQKKTMISMIADAFKRTGQEMLKGKPNFNPDTVIFGRPYFITVTESSEVPEVLKLLDQAQSGDEVFDIIYRQAEHMDFAFAENMASQKPQIIQQVNSMETVGALQMRVHDWLAKRTYRFAMTMYTGFFGKRKVAKLRPPGLTPEEDTAFKAEMKKPQAELFPAWGAQMGYDIACFMTAAYPTWMNRNMGITDLVSWAQHLFPMVESSSYLFMKLPNHDKIAPYISQQVGTNQAGICIRAANVGQFGDALVSHRDEILGIMDRAGHYKDVALRFLHKLEEASAYCVQRGFGLMEASGAVAPF